MREKGRSGAGAPTSKKGLYMRRECAFFKTRRIGIVLKGTFHSKYYEYKKRKIKDSDSLSLGSIRSSFSSSSFLGIKKQMQNNRETLPVE